MDEFKTTPLPLDFYVANGWLNSLLHYYCDEKKYMPREVLQRPLTMLTYNIEKVIAIYGDYPKPVYGGFRQAVDPLFSSEEYEERIYNELLEIIKREERKDLLPIVKALRQMRLMFEQDEMFLRHFFPNEIEMVPPLNDPKGRFRRFAYIVHMIAKIHTLQVAKMIRSR